MKGIVIVIVSVNWKKSIRTTRQGYSAREYYNERYNSRVKNHNGNRVEITPPELWINLSNNTRMNLYYLIRDIMGWKRLSENRVVELKEKLEGKKITVEYRGDLPWVNEESLKSLLLEKK